jgi:uncharacterized membrane protein
MKGFGDAKFDKPVTGEVKLLCVRSTPSNVLTQKLGYWDENFNNWYHEDGETILHPFCYWDLPSVPIEITTKTNIPNF